MSILCSKSVRVYCISLLAAFFFGTSPLVVFADVSYEVTNELVWLNHAGGVQTVNCGLPGIRVVGIGLYSYNDADPLYPATTTISIGSSATATLEWVGVGQENMALASSSLLASYDCVGLERLYIGWSPPDLEWVRFFGGGLSYFDGYFSSIDFSETNGSDVAFHLYGEEIASPVSPVSDASSTAAIIWLGESLLLFFSVIFVLVFGFIGYRFTRLYIK